MQRPLSYRSKYRPASFNDEFVWQTTCGFEDAIRGSPKGPWRSTGLIPLDYESEEAPDTDNQRLRKAYPAGGGYEPGVGDHPVLRADRSSFNVPGAQQGLAGRNILPEWVLPKRFNQLVNLKDRR